MTEVTQEAVDKITQEATDFKGGAKEKAVYKHVAETLKKFSQNEQFAQAVLDSEGTLSDCCTEVMVGVGSSISDIEVYRKATEFYFPHAVIDFTMNITIGIDTLAVGEPVVEKSSYTPPKEKAVPAPVKKKEARPEKKEEAPKEDFIQISLF